MKEYYFKYHYIKANIKYQNIEIKNIFKILIFNNLGFVFKTNLNVVYNKMFKKTNSERKIRFDSKLLKKKNLY